ncbi:MAG: peptide deformylase [Pirellulaceae bacterium]
MEVITFPHPTLRYQSKPIRRVDAELRQSIQEMFELMYEHRGIGLAANQVDLPLRLFVMNLEGERGKGEEFVFINPVISHPKGTEEREEGCLSLPELYAPVVRPKRVRIQAYGIDGREIQADVDGLFARCVQHELDHLDGVLFIDRVHEARLPELQDALDEFATDFDSRRATGGIPSDEQIASRRAGLESRYC